MAHLQLNQDMEDPFHPLVVRLVNLANGHLLLFLEAAMFQLLTAVCEFGRGESRQSLLLLVKPWERELVMVQCDDTEDAVKKRFLGVVPLIVKSVTAIQRT